MAETCSQKGKKYIVVFYCVRR